MTVFLFVSSITLLILLFSIRYWEERHGIRYFRALRDRADAVVREAVFYVVNTWQQLFDTVHKKVAVRGTHAAMEGALKINKKIEKKLTHTTRLMRGRYDSIEQGEASVFLKSVKEHKNEIRKMKKEA